MPTSTAPEYRQLQTPTDGATITFQNGRLDVPARPIIPFIEGDGTGPDIWRASQRVFDAAVRKAYGGKREVVWFEVLAGEKAKNRVGKNASAPARTTAWAAIATTTRSADTARTMVRT